VDVSQFSSLADVHLIDATVIDTSGPAGGAVFVRARDVVFDGFSEIASITMGDEGGGSIMIQAHGLAMTDSVITTSTRGSGNGGDVKIIVDDVFKMTERSIIAAPTDGNGNGGDVSIQAKHFSMVSQSSIRTNTGNFFEFTTGEAGNISLEANSIVIDDGVVESISIFGAGDAGNIEITAGRLRLTNGGRIASDTEFGTGDGGAIMVKADSILIDGASPVSGQLDTGITADSSGFSTGDAGDITIRAINLRMFNGANISTDAGDSLGGNIHIGAQDLVYLLESSVRATAGNGTGGNITIDPVFIILNNSVISASAPGGNGGHIVLDSNFLLASQSVVSADGGVTNGTVSITAPELDLGAQLVTLPVSLIGTESQLRERCTDLLQGDFSSFISIGRGGTEPEPDELQSEF
jgi:hypothetical protein